MEIFDQLSANKASQFTHMTQIFRLHTVSLNIATISVVQTNSIFLRNFITPALVKLLSGSPSSTNLSFTYRSFAANNDITEKSQF